MNPIALFILTATAVLAQGAAKAPRFNSSFRMDAEHRGSATYRFAGFFKGAPYYRSTTNPNDVAYKDHFNSWRIIIGGYPIIAELAGGDAPVPWVCDYLEDTENLGADIRLTPLQHP